MKKEVLICISGAVAADTDENVDVFCPGEYHYRNGKHFLRYEEKIDNDSLQVDTVCMLKFNQESAELTKKGVVNSKFYYEPGQEQRVSYATPYGDFVFDIKTDDLRLVESEHELQLEIDYVIQFTTEERSVFHLKIRVSDEPERILPE